MPRPGAYGIIRHNRAHVWRASRAPRVLAVAVLIERDNRGTFTARACIRTKGRGALGRCAHARGRTPTTAIRTALRALTNRMR